MTRPQFRSRSDYRASRVITTRWLDNDAYGHANNAIYYSWFDTAVNAFLIESGLLDVAGGPMIGLVVESGCRYARPLGFPHPVTAMLRVGHLGASSVRYEIGLFSEDAGEAAAEGHFTHVYVDRETRRPVSLPKSWREALEELLAR